MAADISILVEAEHFADFGGWCLDQQFMDQMGSPYLLAHGLGQPVADASTSIVVPQAATYRVWVRTFDWVAPWNAPGTPGAFQLLINEEPLSTTFGTKGDAWDWQDGGTIVLPAGDVTLALHDLTGFEGRCDAILLTTDQALVPPNEPVKLEAFRRELLGLPETPDDGGTFDLVVAGGGLAGICAAVAAARSGLQVALVNDRPVFGGNNSSEVQVRIDGDINLPPYPQIGNIVSEIETIMASHGTTSTPSTYEHDSHRTNWLAAEDGVTLFTLHRVMDAETENGCILAVIVQDVVSARRKRLQASFFADCTGDGALGALAKADFDMTMSNHMGPTNVWGVVDSGVDAPFPRCPWALDLSQKPFPGRGEHSAQWARPGLGSLGGWFWESGFDLDPINDVERMRDTNFRAMYGAWDALKNVDDLYPTHRLRWCAYITGKRESRRLLGDVIITRGDLYQQHTFPDACVPCTWQMDVHVPHREYQAGFEGEEFISWCVIGEYAGRPFWLPYRALYSRNIDNLFMAGRDISATHEALGTVRVMRTCGMMGEVVGMAAALCLRLNATPRALYTQHLPELQSAFKSGVPDKKA